jgi:hypothetical protein
LRKTFDDTQAELAKIPMNGVRINTLDIGGPYSQATGATRASLQRIYTCGHLDGVHTPMCARRIVTDFARRAFRRPVTPRELAPYINLVQQVEKEEGSLAEGLAVGIQAILDSPDFLFRIERDHPASAAKAALHYPISQQELASRLSYFLWSSMPDASLRHAADTGTLRSPAVLAAQVRRMLPRSEVARARRELRRSVAAVPRARIGDARSRALPDFEDYLRFSMRRETELFIEDVIRQDRKVLDFIDGKYSFINERLARITVSRRVRPEFRRVDLSASRRAAVYSRRPAC